MINTLLNVNSFFQNLQPWFLFILLPIIIIYILPGMIASSRGTKNCTQVWIITIFLGFSYVGRVIALTMAFSPDLKKEESNNPTWMTENIT